MNEDAIPARLERLAAIALALPEAKRSSLTEQHTSFDVRGKRFAYHLVDHHGDGRVALCCKVAPGENTALAAAEPARFFIPPYIGPRGWVGLDLEAAAALDWDEVTKLLVDSYVFTAPKRLGLAVGH